MSLAWTFLALTCSGVGVALLHCAWCRRGGAGLSLAGWLLLASAALPWRMTGAAWDKATAFAALVPSLLVAALLLWEMDTGNVRRREKPGRNASAVELPASAGSLWRALARTALAGPVAGTAALGLAALIALRAPWGEADRLVAAAFALPFAWAAAGVWATTDGRLGRVCAGLTVLAVAGFGGALL